jgi:hypothetical protein
MTSSSSSAQIHRRGRITMAVLSSALAVAGLALVAVSPAAGASHSRWTTLSTGNVHDSLVEPSIHRFGKDYQVVWVVMSGTTFGIDSRILNSSGKPVGGVVHVIKGWSGIQADPTIFGISGQRLIAFAGDRSSSGSDPYRSGAEYYLSSPNGTKWTLSTGSLSHSTFADRDTGAAAIDDHGVPVVDFTVGDVASYHVGFDSSNPAAKADGATANTGNFAYTPGLGRDAKSGAVWAVWYSNSSSASTDGVNAQAILPSKESRLHAPSSHKGSSSTGVQQDLPAAARPKSKGGGVYTAYATPLDHSIAVWRLGAKHALIVKDLTGPREISLTADPKGRLWLWWRSLDGRWHATRSNRAATRFGARTMLRAIKDANGANVAAAGSTRSLEAVAVVTSGSGVTRIVATQIRPKLTVRVAHKAVARGHSVKVTVADAGDAVRKAKVHFEGATKLTNRHGKVSFHTSHATPLGKHVIKARKAGYAGAHTRVKIK